MAEMSSSQNGANQRSIKRRKRQISLYWSTSIAFCAFTVATTFVLFGDENVRTGYCSGTSTILSKTMSIYIALYWSATQWTPRLLYDDKYQQMNSAAWNFWESDDYCATTNRPSNDTFLEDIPTVYVQDHASDDLLPYIESMYGKDWRRRPLLLKGLWKLDELKISNTDNQLISHRRLSLHGLLQENLTIPYFTDARKVGAITPDGFGTVQDIIRNITFHNAPHKIATQLLVQAYPELIEEVAPLSIVAKLFDQHASSASSSYYFTPNAIRGSKGPTQMFPKLTTVPLFVAHSRPLPRDTTTTTTTDNSDNGRRSQETSLPHTALHCEPIGNVAVQLSGEKLWTLIRPEYSHWLRPTIAPDGRAFFLSSLPISQIKDEGSGRRSKGIPYYQAITAAGDALWVPTWTWHRVDYVSSSTTTTTTLPRDNMASSSNGEHYPSTKVDLPPNGHHEHSSHIAIGASLFHFRPLDFIQNNPWYALLIVPAIVLELIGVKTQ